MMFGFNDMWMYWTHRWLHGRWGFSHVHKIHHRFFAPTPFSTMVSLYITAPTSLYSLLSYTGLSPSRGTHTVHAYAWRGVYATTSSLPVSVLLHVAIHKHYRTSGL